MGQIYFDWNPAKGLIEKTSKPSGHLLMHKYFKDNKSLLDVAYPKNGVTTSPYLTVKEGKV